MADKENEIMDDNEDLLVVMTDEDGNEFYYREELIIPVGDQKFALLVGVNEDDEDHHHDCDCGCDEEEDVFIAKIVTNDKGEEEYIDPTDEEFDAVQAAYDKLMDEEEAEQE